MHKHEFTLVNTLTMRYRCACGVWGYRHGRRRIMPFTCGATINNGVRKRCGAEAVVINGDRNHARCAEHTAPHEDRAA
jgi:hypothetical protein